MVQIARILYNATLIEDYLDYIFEYYDKEKDRSAIAVLTYLKPCDKLYDFFAGLYLNSDDSVTRSPRWETASGCFGNLRNSR